MSLTTFLFWRYLNRTFSHLTVMFMVSERRCIADCRYRCCKCKVKCRYYWLNRSCRCKSAASASAIDDASPNATRAREAMAVTKLPACTSRWFCCIALINKAIQSTTQYCIILVWPTSWTPAVGGLIVCE